MPAKRENMMDLSGCMRDSSGCMRDSLGCSWGWSERRQDHKQGLKASRKDLWE